MQLSLPNLRDTDQEGHEGLGEGQGTQRDIEMQELISNESPSSRSKGKERILGEEHEVDNGDSDSEDEHDPQVLITLGVNSNSKSLAGRELNSAEKKREERGKHRGYRRD